MMKQSGIIRVEKPSNILVTIARANYICEQSLAKWLKSLLVLVR
jgi:hypothetical protein